MPQTKSFRSLRAGHQQEAAALIQEHITGYYESTETT